jgi:hypothetical protein
MRGLSPDIDGFLLPLIRNLFAVSGGPADLPQDVIVDARISSLFAVSRFEGQKHIFAAATVCDLVLHGRSSRRL